MTSMDISRTLEPNSNQLNADDLIAGPRTVTVAAITKGTPEQPVNVVTEEFGPNRPYKPSKSMRRVLASAWGSDASVWIGRKITLYRDGDIMFGKDRVGGIRISHLSHIDQKLELSLTVSRGKRAPFTVQPLASE